MIELNAYKNMMQGTTSGNSPGTGTRESKGALSSSRRPKNQIGFMEGEEDGIVESNMVISVEEVPCEEKLMHHAPQ